jgi:hypothetical protein
MLTSLPSVLERSATSNSGSLVIPLGSDAGTAEKILQDACLLFARQESHPLIAKVATKYGELQQEWFMGTVSVKFCVKPQDGLDYASLTECHILLVSKHSDEISRTGAIRQGPIQVTVYWRFFEAITESPQLYDCVVLHHESRGGRKYLGGLCGPRSCRRWTTTHYNKRGYTVNEIGALHDSLRQAMSAIKLLDPVASSPWALGGRWGEHTPNEIVIQWRCPNCPAHSDSCLWPLHTDTCSTCNWDRDWVQWCCRVCDQLNPISRFECDCGGEISDEAANALLTACWRCRHCTHAGNRSPEDAFCTMCFSPRSGREYQMMARTIISGITDTARIEGTGEGPGEQFSISEVACAEDEEEEAGPPPSPEQSATLRWVCCQLHLLSTEQCGSCGTPRFTWDCHCNHECEIWHDNCPRCGFERPVIFVNHRRLLRLDQDA